MDQKPQSSALFVILSKFNLLNKPEELLRYFSGYKILEPYNIYSKKEYYQYYCCYFLVNYPKRHRI